METRIFFPNPLEGKKLKLLLSTYYVLGAGFPPPTDLCDALILPGFTLEKCEVQGGQLTAQAHTGGSRTSLSENPSPHIPQVPVLAVTPFPPQAAQLAGGSDIYYGRCGETHSYFSGGTKLD